jgi:hypothetical protein
MNLQVLTDRLYGAILMLTALGFAVGGGLILYWGVAGLPEELARAVEAHSGDARFLLGLKVLGWSCLFAAALNAVFSVFAFRGHLWAIVANTIGWSLLLVPTLGQPTMVAVAILATLIGLTVLAVVARYRRSAQPI